MFTKNINTNSAIVTYSAVSSITITSFVNFIISERREKRYGHGTCF
nr:MAG TPA: hypothetical protein [Caudoviricetes sp.]